MSRLLLFFLALFQGLLVAEAAQLLTHDSSFVPDFVLRVTSSNYSIACNSRLSALANGSSPGPEIRLQGGKTTWIRVYNDMQDKNTTMHWHGLSQRMAIFSDGTPTASQWPIPPLHFYDYEIKPDVTDAGTYFYHAHVGFSAVTVHGPLIVEDAGGIAPYHYDEERTIVISDYFNKTDKAIEDGLVAKPFLWSGETNAILVNGVGISNWQPTVQSPSCGLAVIDVKPGKTYRFRAIGATALTMAKWGIESHSNYTVIAADGQYTQPAPIDHMQIASGQRFDFLLTTKSAAELAKLNRTSFFIQLESRERPANATGYAVLRYDTSVPAPTAPPTTKPLTLPQSVNTWLESTLAPLRPNGFPRLAEVTRRVSITVQQVGASAAMVAWDQNGLAWTETTRSSPYLVDIYEHGQAAIPSMQRASQHGGWDPELDAWPAKRGEVLEIVLQSAGSLPGNGSFDYHPFHAHGGHYYDLGSGNGTYDPVANEKKFEKGYTPALRDTTVLYKYSEGRLKPGDLLGWRAWRIRVTDPGVWMLHCHVLQHMIMGMQMVWVFGDSWDIATIPHPMAAGYMTYGGSAYGNESWAPSVVHQFDS